MTTPAIKPVHRLSARDLLYRALPSGDLSSWPTWRVELWVGRLADLLATGQAVGLYRRGDVCVVRVGMEMPA